MVECYPSARSTGQNWEKLKLSMRQNILFIFVVFLSGCTGCHNNAQKTVPQKYLVTEDVFLMQVDEGRQGPRLALVPASKPGRGSGFYASPKSLETNSSGQWETNDVVGNKDVVGIVTAGTKIEFVRTKTKKSWSWWYFAVDEDTVNYGKIISGPFLGKVVDLEDVLHWPKKRIEPTE